MAQAKVVATGINEEFRHLFEAHYDYLWTSLRRLGVHERDVEDVAHEVLLEVHAKLDRYDRGRPFRPWLFAFAVRFASDYRKLARHKTELSGEIDASRASTPNAEEILGAKDTARLLDLALDALSIDLRAVLVLYEIDETPMKQIADAFEIPLNTAYSRLRLARARCAETIARATTGDDKR
jgi:RNA polymerase sigma-70 factor, ECF subfamily